MADPKLTVAVTGPTGDIGRALLRRLDRDANVGRVLGMARRPFDPAELGLKKTEYRQGDVLDRGSVDEFVAGADVVVHLAFIIMGGREESRRINLQGSRNVFEAATAAKTVKRLVYTSSVAAYGFHEDNPDLLTEDVEPRGTEQHTYSAQKAEVETALRECLAGSDTDAYVLRPCIVSGPDALILIENMPYVKISEKLPGAVRRLFDVMPILKPVVPDPGVPFQLVHHDDVARAIAAAIAGRGKPGIYNLAGEGTITLTQLANALGWYAIPVPDIAVDATVEVVSRLPFLPTEAEWVNTMRTPVLMDIKKARRQLRWFPKYDARETLEQTVEAARAEGLV